LERVVYTTPESCHRYLFNIGDEHVLCWNKKRDLAFPELSIFSIPSHTDMHPHSGFFAVYESVDFGNFQPGIFVHDQLLASEVSKMHPADIQAALKKKGITQKDIAAEIGRSPLHVSQVILKKRVSDLVMRAVAKKIKRDPAKVFPEYYRGKKTRKHGHQIRPDVPVPGVQDQDSDR
jgi:lambda repressor-like predicted transcriptional regulator